MPAITLRRHPVKFYLSVIFLLAFLSGLGMLFITMPGARGDYQFGRKIAMVLGILFILFGLYTAWKYVSNAPRIIIEGNFVTFRSRIFKVSDIRKVEFHKKVIFPMLFDPQTRATVIHFKDGRQGIIYENFFMNAGELKTYLGQNTIIGRDATMEPAEEILELYSGNPFFSFRGVTLWVVLLPVLYVSLHDNTSYAGVIIAVLFCSMWIAINRWSMHYFEISDKMLLVKNHLDPFLKRTYSLDTVANVNYETKSRQAECIRLIFKDTHVEVFPGGTLNANTWRQLKDRLQRTGIKVK
ncbi:hypothetical protein JMG10_11100 [Nostoc ellipsosporum NOK]|jgi:hypothetical protein|nr:hypothetical protein [Nostoc ellipsosporum NOK]